LLLPSEVEAIATFAGSARAFSISRTEGSFVRATMMYGAGDVRVEQVPDATVRQPGQTAKR
jgi:hypothetical protein